MHPGAERQHDHRHRAVDRVSGGDLAVPGCRKCSDAGCSTPSGQRSTENTVPTGTLTSMFGGSLQRIEHQQVTCPAGIVGGIWYGWSMSRDAMARS